MCLSYIVKQYKRKRTSGWAWKAFIKVSNSKAVTPYIGTTISRGKWCQATRATLMDEIAHKEYTSGFHLWAEKPEFSPYYGVIKVRYRGGHTLGAQWGKKVIVADEIYVPKPRHMGPT